MFTIAHLFVKSPFAPLQTHMDKVASCVTRLSALLEAIIQGDSTAISKIAEEISKLEHEADLTKNDIRNHLPRSLFLPVDRKDLHEILSHQDSIADQTEAIAYLATFRTIVFTPNLKEDFIALYRNSLAAFWLVRDVIKELDELLESSFGGIEAEKVKGMIEQIAAIEEGIPPLQRRIMKQVFQKEDDFPSFYLLLQLIEQIRKIASLSEKLANRIRMLLELR